MGVAQAWLFADFWWQPDTVSYAAAIERLITGEGSDRLMRLSKPFALLLPAGLWVVGVEARWGLLLQSWLAMGVGLWAAYGCFRYWLGATRARGALWLYVGCGPVAVYGWAALTDSVGWALAWLGLYMLARVVARGRVESRWALSFGIFIGMGLLVKESVLVAGWGWAWWVLLRGGVWREKLRLYIWSGLGLGLALALGLWWTRWVWGYNLLDWFAFNHDDEAEMHVGGWLLPYVVQALRALDLVWLLVVAGLWRIYRRGDMRGEWAWVLVVAGLSGALVYPFVWAYMSDRIIFMFAPFWVGIAGFALRGDGRDWWLVAGAVAGCLAAAYVSYVGVAGLSLWGVYLVFGLGLGAAGRKNL